MFISINNNPEKQAELIRNAAGVGLCVSTNGGKRQDHAEKMQKTKFNTFLCIFLWICVSSYSYCSDINNSNDVSKISNIGFIENPSQELQNRFKMCESFLNVEWIDKEKLIGYSHYEAYVKNDEKKLVWALIDMDASRIDFDVYKFKRQNRLVELFDMVRKGKVEIGVGMEIKYKRRKILLYSGNALNNDEIRPLLANHRQNVCITYPDEKRAWIVEGKRVGNVYSDTRYETLRNKINAETGSNLSQEFFGRLWVLDINFDGINDFTFDRLVIYSIGNNFFSNKRKTGFNYFEYFYPPTNHTCQFRISMIPMLITNGKNYYLNDCNLTELTSKKIKE